MEIIPTIRAPVAATAECLAALLPLSLVDIPAKDATPLRCNSTPATGCVFAPDRLLVAWWPGGVGRRENLVRKALSKNRDGFGTAVPVALPPVRLLHHFDTFSFRGKAVCMCIATNFIENS